MADSGAAHVAACPGCGTRLRVSEAQLAAAGGKVRCGACLAVFDGRDHLVAGHGGHAGVARPRPAAGSGRRRRGHRPRQRPAAPTRAAPRPPAAGKPPPAAQEPAAKSAAGAAARPGAAQAAQEVAAARGARKTVVLVCVVLLATLAIQAFALQFERWSRHPALRGVYAPACELIGCELPPLRSLAAIRLYGELDATRASGRLALHGALVSRAAFAQDYPTVLLRLYAAGGADLAEHRLAPADYLEGEVRVMRPNQVTRIALQVEDPGAEATNYRITLL